MKKTGLSFEQHLGIGSKLKDFHRQMTTIGVEISNSYPRTSKVHRLATKSMRALDELRCELDNQLFRDCPTQTSNDEWRGIYYGESNPDQ